MGTAIQIRTVVFRDKEHWVAQCLEYDIGAQAPDVDTLQKRLRAVISAECKASIEAHGKPFAGIDPAPEFYHNLWETKSAKLMPVNSVGAKADGTVSLEYGLCA